MVNRKYLQFNGRIKSLPWLKSGDELTSMVCAQFPMARAGDRERKSLVSMVGRSSAPAADRLTDKCRQTLDVSCLLTARSAFLVGVTTPARIFYFNAHFKSRLNIP